MIRLDLHTIAQVLHANLIGDGNVWVENASTDTRESTKNGLFFALKGEKFDAHHYVAQAVQQGCIALVVEQATEMTVPQLVVKDTRLALGQLAQWLKAKLAPKTVAMTGSSGKTTVKEMTAAILRQTAGELAETADKNQRVLFTNGNFNNDIGVPLTLLRLTEQHQFAVIELGANHQGEIAYTTNLVKPDVALVNNVAAAHLEGFGSIDGVAQAKGEIYLGLPENGTAIINLNCHYLDKWQKNIAGKKLQSFSVDNTAADFYATDVRLTETGSHFTLHSPNGNIGIDLPYLGEHNISNALAASALAMNVGASLQNVKQGLEQGSFVKGRLFPIKPCDNLLLLDDTYNANVDSLQSAIRVLQKYPAFRILVVGDMAELGENTKLCHQQVADFAQQAKLDLVLSFGQDSVCISMACQGKHFDDKAALVDYLIPIIEQNLEQKQQVVLLAKGSRRMKMEEVINLLKGRFVC